MWTTARKDDDKRWVVDWHGGKSLAFTGGSGSAVLGLYVLCIPFLLLLLLLLSLSCVSLPLFVPCSSTMWPSTAFKYLCCSFILVDCRQPDRMHTAQCLFAILGTHVTHRRSSGPRAALASPAGRWNESIRAHCEWLFFFFRDSSSATASSLGPIRRANLLTGSSFYSGLCLLQHPLLSFGCGSVCKAEPSFAGLGGPGRMTHCSSGGKALGWGGANLLSPAYPFGRGTFPRLAGRLAFSLVILPRDAWPVRHRRQLFLCALLCAPPTNEGSSHRRKNEGLEIQDDGVPSLEGRSWKENERLGK